MKNTFTILIICCVLLHATPLHANESTWIGMINDDGVLVPVALFEDNKWSNPWEKFLDKWSDLSMQSVINEWQNLKLENLTDIPKEWLGKSQQFPDTWLLSDYEGNEKSFKVFKPFKQINTAFDYAPPKKHHWGLLPATILVQNRSHLIGMALSKKSEVYPAKRLTSLYDNNIRPFLERQFRKLETNQIEKEHGKFNNNNKSSSKEDIISYMNGIPLKPEEREKYPILISALYQIDIKKTGESIYYFEAHVSYADSEDKSFYNGFMRHNKDRGYWFYEDNFYVGDSDDSAIVTSQLAGVVALGKNLYLIREKGPYENKEYVIELITDKEFKEVLSTSAGG